MTETILVVDDEKDLELIIRQKYRKEIQAKTYAFFFAHNGVEALELLENQPEISIVLTDINMPEMDGLELLSRIETLHRPLLKTIIISAYDDMNNIRTAMNNGAVDFLTKPLDLNDLTITLKNTSQRLNEQRTYHADHRQLLTIKQDLKIAQNIQQSFLPKSRQNLTIHHRVSLFGKMQPALEIGGDFYDFFPLDDRRLAFVVGDVAGKGIGAAMFMGVSRILIRAAGQRTEQSLDCISYVNNIVCENSEDVFVALFYGIIDCVTGMIDYTNAGHSAPYLLRHDGTTEELPVDHNLVVGVMPDVAYQSKQLQLGAGDTLLICTDGLTETFGRDHQFYAKHQLRKTLQTLVGETPETIVQTIINDVMQFAEDKQHLDDMTLLGVKFSEENSPCSMNIIP